MNFSSKSVAIKAKHLFIQGRELHKSGNFAKAEAAYIQVLKLIPTQPDALHLLGVAAFQQNRFEESERLIASAIRYSPKAALAYYNHGNALRKLARFDEAINSFTKAYELDPSDNASLENLGNIYKELNEFEKAHYYYDFLLSRDPDNLIARSNKAIALLTEGRLSEGWSLYEDRLKWRKPGENFVIDAIPRQAPDWKGQVLDKPLLILPEQGLGDQIFFSSILNDIADRRIESFVCVDERLMKIFSRSFPQLNFATPTQIARLDPQDKLFGAQIMIGSLAKYFRCNSSDMGRIKSPFLYCDEEKKSQIRQRLSFEKSIRIGISWKSNNSPYGREKTCSLFDLAPLLFVPSIELIDLQYGDTLEERLRFEKEYKTKITKLDDIDNQNEIDDLSALISACDIVLTISNSTAHLAAALGKPTLVLLPWHTPLWYWHLNSMDSPWYPSTVLLRQGTSGDWSGPVGQAAKIIQKLINESTSSLS
jgi:tetratricopeptide (TPR) repeat protein